jgi:transcriptional regulator with GAF, ATPase, and Fis domain
VDARLIAATNRDLGQMVADGEFREDLYYRLAVFPITVPSLRERRDDIPLLVDHFVARYSQRMRRTIKQIPQSALQAITEWPWPGNVRELQNFIERSVILTKGECLEVALQELRQSRTGSPIKDADYNVIKGANDNLNLRNLEREAILEALRKTQGRLGGASGAAAMLGLKRTTLQSRMRILDIKMSHEVANTR